MAAITDSFRKVVDFVMDGFRGGNPFVDMNDSDEYEDDYDEETYKYWSRVCHVYGLDESVSVSGSGSRRGGPPGGE